MTEIKGSCLGQHMVKGLVLNKGLVRQWNMVVRPRFQNIPLLPKLRDLGTVKYLG